MATVQNKIAIKNNLAKEIQELKEKIRVREETLRALDIEIRDSCVHIWTSKPRYEKVCSICGFIPSSITW